MLSRLPALLVTAVLGIGAALVSAPSSHAVACLTSGSGTSGDPYLIGTSADLLCLMNNGTDYWVAGLHFRQTADIDMTGQTPTPIGGNWVAFRGAYDGDDHAITGLSIVSGSSAPVGLFGYTVGAVFTSITVSGSITAEHYVGGLVGIGDGGTSITDCHSSVNVTSNNTGANHDDFGGLVGTLMNGGGITDSSATGSVTWDGSGNASAFGGLVGSLAGTTLSNSWSSSTVTGQSRVGGLVGDLHTAVIERSYATGSISGESVVGGLVGFLYRANPAAAVVVDSYARGPVSSSGALSTARAGSLVGWTELSWPTASRSYGTGAVTRTGNGELGGIIGATPGTWSSSFWDTTTTGKATAQYSGAVPGTAGKSTAQMTDITTFQAAGWSISNVEGSGATWGICQSINDGYPFLRAFYDVQPCTTPAPTSTVIPAPTVFTLGLNANGGSCQQTSIRGDAGTWVILPSAGSCDREGFALVGWSTDPSAVASSFEPGSQTALTGDNTLFAVWRKVEQQSTATAPGGSAGSPQLGAVTIARTGARHRIITLTGTLAHAPAGTQVQIWYRTRGGQLTRGPLVTIDDSGRFTWTTHTRHRLSAFVTMPETSLRSTTITA